METKLKPVTHASGLGRLLPNAALLALALLALAACATVPQQADPLISRAQARWNAMVAGEYEKAYAYYSPGFRSAISQTDFVLDMRVKRVRWTAAAYRDHNCEDNVCTVRFDIEYEALKPVPGVDKYNGKAVNEDNWVKTGGEWWYVPKK